VACGPRILEKVGDELPKARRSHGLTVFGQIDHVAAASEAGFGLAAEEVVLFGNPRAGMALIQSDPRIGVELPFECSSGRTAKGTRLGYNDPFELAGRMTSNSTTRPSR
jgi:uncharacterized protein (DUF302 family)